MRRLTLIAALLGVVVTTLAATSLAFAQETGSGPTEAPDLESVGNFRAGPATDDGGPQTLVDFAFDQAAYLNGGDRSNFQIVPLDAGDALSGSTNAVPAEDPEGDNVVTVLFPGDLDPADFARGYVDTGTVNSDPNNVGNEAPANINQAANISPNTKTENPDLVRVRSGANGSLIFEFDEPLTDDDVVQNNSGLRVYFSETEQAGTIREAGAIRVERVNSRSLRAFFGEDLPEGKMLDDAVGAFVRQGTVQSAQGSRGGNDGVNAFDEVLLDGGCTITGTDGDDDLNGTQGRDVICGLGGDDTIRGFGGSDTIRGGSGDDRLVGGDGQDRLLGQAGEDELFGQGDGDLIRGGADGDLLVGGGGDDNVAGQVGDDRLFGQDGDDKLFGQAGEDILRGDAGGDRLIGGDGNDNAVGGAGEDTIFGQAGADVLRGGEGQDLLAGGDGNDNVADFSGPDTLLGQDGNDFLNTRDQRGDDRINGGTGRDGCRADPNDAVNGCP